MQDITRALSMAWCLQSKVTMLATVTVLITLRLCLIVTNPNCNPS